jgi:hypothetical protein
MTRAEVVYTIVCVTILVVDGVGIDSVCAAEKGEMVWYNCIELSLAFAVGACRLDIVSATQRTMSPNKGKRSHVLFVIKRVHQATKAHEE